MSASKQFTGPIFLVGMPRSGTKLLVNVLNNHSMIAIPGNESHFMPLFLTQMSKYGDLKEFVNFQKFYHDLSNTNFMKRLAAKGFAVSAEQWHQAVESRSHAGIIETFYQLYAKRHKKSIWGDKTPFYMLHLPLLASHFPAAKFVHIIRDARDHCLSAHKIWHKNLFRSAQRWHDYVSECRWDGRAMSSDHYQEIRYEALIDSPAPTIGSICDFLGVPFEPEMLHLKKPSENYGDTKGKTTIVKQNYQKWRNELSARQVRKIEKVCGALLADLGYSVTYTGDTEKLGALEMLLYRGIDAFYQLRFEAKQKNGRNRMWDTIRQNRFNRWGSKVAAAKDRG